MDFFTSGLIPSAYAQIDHFLTPSEHSELLTYVARREVYFESTMTSTEDPDYRRSKTLYYFPCFNALVCDRIQTRLPEVMSRLTIEPFPISQIEAQLTAHGDGDYYKIHNDNGSSDTATREVTYVYYFYREPKPFSGGELILYDSRVENGFYVQAESFHRIEPRNNSVIFFLSRCLHEVRPVRCSSRAFIDSRFTINGWVRRA